MARTRSTKGPTAKEKADAKAEKAKTAATSSSSTYTLAPETENPPLFFILPKAATPEARIVTLQNPRYAKPSRYLVCPEAGFFEFNKISPPKNVPRSWLLESNVRIEGDANEGDARLESQIFDSPDLFIATPIDPLFLVLTALAATKSSGDTKASQKRMFLASDDHLDTLSELSGGHLSEVLTWPASRALLEARIAAVSDSVEAGDEQMYRLSETKLLDEIVAKARRMSDKGLPRSLEEKFVTKELEAPILGIRSQPAPAKAPVKEDSDSPQPEAVDSQSTVSSVATPSSSLSEASTAATSVSGDTAGNETVENAMTAPEEVLRLQRLRTAFNFICASYVAPGLANTLKRMLPTTETVDFKPLDEYMAKLAKLRQEAAAVRTGDYSRKRGCEEEADERAEKRRKQEAEDKIKKANQSRGVKSLAKVSTAGMKKMSDFFKKK
ncbi:ribonuclease H2, subunit B [Schizothecium vesticola]|uniref:Ribonuclease H2 subunit B n=1 Tax=Schizothecium vesticola TaxID=314040 RepID=A0AA40K2C9_9PEZI|nr:ribonuclease H2, subunit B [Schizothecium vesticola]